MTHPLITLTAGLFLAHSAAAEWEPRGLCHVWTGKEAPEEAPEDMLTGVLYDYNRNTKGNFFTYSEIYAKQGKQNLAAAIKIRSTGARNPTNSPDVHGQFVYTLKELIQGKYGILKKYYKYPYHVAASHIYMAPISFPSLDAELQGRATAEASDFIDEEAPGKSKKDGKAKAYDDHISWFGVFRGKVIAPRSMTFRFYGAADDAIAVRFDDRLVLETGFFKPALYQGNGLKDKGCDWSDIKAYQQEVAEGKHRDKKDYVVRKLKSTPFCNDCFNGITGGKPITVTKDKTYPIEIIIGNNGGASLFYLLTQEVTPDNNAPLQLFRTSTATPAMPPSFKGYSDKHFHEKGPDFAADSDIWQIATKTGKTKLKPKKTRNALERFQKVS